ncbi:MAG: hypothetical protein GY940_15195 [bacterium]|nr:hypothetical protein [bacterium]
MQTYHIETVVLEEGVVTIEGLPLPPGEKVEVIVKESPSNKDKLNPYPLRGQPLSYDSPFDSVAENDWSVGLKNN